MSNPFAPYFDHFSPSHLNLYAKQPAKWALCYLHGFRDDGSAAMWRGSAVEDGVSEYLFKRDLGAAIAVAHTRFEIDALGLADDATEKERQAIAGMVEHACIALANREPPDARQLKVEYWFDGIEIPVIGYVDYIWPEKGLELKSTNRMPPEISEEHACQGAFYSVCKARPWEFLYVTKSKSELRPLENPREYVKRLEWYAHAIRRLLCVCPDKFDASRLFVPDFDHPYLWKTEASREAAAQIWT